MSELITWNIYCITEGDWVTGQLYDTDGNPTECFNDSGHTINPNSFQEVLRESLEEANSTTTGAIQTKGGISATKSICAGGCLIVNGVDTGDPTIAPQLNIQAISVTDTTTVASGTLGTFNFNTFKQSTLNASNSSVTTTDAATVYIEGPPLAGTNETITNSYSLIVDGNVRLNGFSVFEQCEAYIRDEKAVGTNGGTFTKNQWNVRDLNTITTDAGSGISLASNQITLAAGTYVISGSVPANSVKVHTCRLYNTTDSTADIIGTTEEGGNSSRSFFYGKITIASTKVYELQHRGSKTKNNYGFGKANGDQTELYTIVLIRKVK